MGSFDNLEEVIESCIHLLGALHGTRELPPARLGQPRNPLEVGHSTTTSSGQSAGRSRSRSLVSTPVASTFSNEIESSCVDSGLQDGSALCLVCEVGDVVLKRSWIKE